MLKAKNKVYTSCPFSFLFFSPMIANWLMWVMPLLVLSYHNTCGTCNTVHVQSIGILGIGILEIKVTKLSLFFCRASLI